jgi:3',5'-cyclic-AMP phosphodiesterase
MNSLKKTGTILMILLTVLSVACSNLIEYSPYDADVSERNLNISEMSRISSDAQSLTDTFKFALFSDIHENYDDMSDAINSINKLNGLQFVACCGDITNSGLAQEFEWYTDVAAESLYPLITVIGNHDYLSNGYSIYTKLFGEPNMSFTVNKYKFILFDDIIWENNNKEPDYGWLSNELADSNYYHVIMSHIPPYSDEMKGINGLAYDKIVDSTNTILCLHGHCHCFNELTFNGVHTMVTGDIDDGEYYIISLVNDHSIIKRVSF